MPGPVALVGAGEFLPTMADFDRGLLGATGRRRPRVVIVPTASFPDGEAVFQRWALAGQQHFETLGAEVEPVLIRRAEDAHDPACAQAIGEADLIYLSGGKPRYLLDILRDSPSSEALRAAHERGAVLAGCSAGAMVLAERQVDVRRRIGWPFRWSMALGLVPAAAVLPHYNAFPETISAAFALLAPRGIALLGIDEQTAIMGRDGSWQVHGRARVTVWRGRRRMRHRAGEIFRLPDQPSDQAASDLDRDATI